MTKLQMAISILTKELNRLKPIYNKTMRAKEYLAISSIERAIASLERVGEPWHDAKHIMGIITEHLSDDERAYKLVNNHPWFYVPNIVKREFEYNDRITDVEIQERQIVLV